VEFFSSFLSFLLYSSLPLGYDYDDVKMGKREEDLSDERSLP
jgi:hypothetical protein